MGIKVRESVVRLVAGWLERTIYGVRRLKEISVEVSSLVSRNDEAHEL